MRLPSKAYLDPSRVRLLTDGLYHIVIGDTVSDLILKVNHMMESGWVPQGGVYKEQGRHIPLTAIVWYQAKIRPLITNQALVV